MTPVVVRRALHRSLNQIRYVTPVRPRQAHGVVADVYEQVERDFGMLAPPIALHSPAPSALAASWVMLRETLVANGSVDKADKEAVASAVSLSNGCPYCVDVHTTSLRGLAFGADASAIADGRIDAIADPRRRELARSARDGVAGTLPAELVGVAVTFHYLNRMVNVFLGESVLPPEVPAFAHRPLMALMGRLVGSAAWKAGPGESLPLLPEAPLPGDMAWAADSPVIADALARAAAALDAPDPGALPESVRALVRARLSAWDGRPPGPDRGWLDEAVAKVPAADRDAAGLALATAFSSYRVTPDVIARFRRTRADDKALIELTSWASLAAARHMATLLTGR